jgi:hypothetical protein
MNHSNTMPTLSPHLHAPTDPRLCVTTTFDLQDLKNLHFRHRLPSLHLNFDFRLKQEFGVGPKLVL